MARSCFKHGKTTPDSHYKTPYYNSNLVTAVITKSPSPAQGLYCVIFHCIICFVISLYLISQGLQGLEFFSGCRDFKLLSFGAEAEEDEELNVQMSEVGIRCQFKPACTMYMHPKVAIFDQPCRSTVAKKNHLFRRHEYAAFVRKESSRKNTTLNLFMQQREEHARFQPLSPLCYLFSF